MNVYYKRLHISERQIGVLAALSPWVNASSGQGLFCSVAAVRSLATDVHSSLTNLQALLGLPLLTILAGTSPF